MEFTHAKGDRPGEGYKLIGLGGTFAGAIILFTFGGLMIDRWLGLTAILSRGQARHPDQEGVAPRENGGEDALEYLVLTHDSPTDLLEELGFGGGQVAE